MLCFLVRLLFLFDAGVANVLNLLFGMTIALPHRAEVPFLSNGTLAV